MNYVLYGLSYTSVAPLLIDSVWGHARLDGTISLSPSSLRQKFPLFSKRAPTSQDAFTVTVTSMISLTKMPEKDTPVIRPNVIHAPKMVCSFHQSININKGVRN